MTELLNWSRNLESTSQVSTAHTYHMLFCTDVVPEILNELSRGILSHSGRVCDDHSNESY